MRIEPFKLERYYAQYEFTTRYMLSSSDSESCSVGDLLALEPEAAERLHALWLGYTESPGTPWLREEIARIYQRITPDDVLVHTGAEEGIFTFYHALLAPGTLYDCPGHVRFCFGRLNMPEALAHLATFLASA